MKQQRVFTTLFLILLPLFFALFLNSCVSSLLKEAPPTFSKEVTFDLPGGDFTKITKSVFPAWKSKTTSNVISIISDCSEINIYTLDDLQQLISASIEKPNILNKESVIYKDKPAQKRTVEGEIEGNSIVIQSLSFRRGNCGYVTSLSGRPKVITKDENTYQQFNESLKFK